tara:strand:- start:2848 stop:4284 length:1437 start_codon:yes stop_codon:yes gene_type:complete
MASKVDKRFEDVMDLQKGLSDSKIDEIVEGIIASSAGDYLEPFSAAVIPLGTNDDTARQLYHRRRYYNEHAFPKPSPSQNIMDGSAVDDNSKYQGTSRKVFTSFNHVDYNHQKIFYGRIDTLNNSIYPSEKFLKLVNGTKDVMLLNFVADALNDMLEKLDRLKSSGKINKKSSYYNFTPQAGWMNIISKHHRLIRSLYQRFTVNICNTPSIATKITSYDTFTKYFIDFLSRFLPKFPITRTNMILRSTSNPRMSGIVFELSRKPHGDDKLKYVDYILDPHFLLIQKIANGFGFMVDKNAPWRFIADLESPQMRHRMNEHGFQTLQGMFDKYYYKAHLHEIDTIRKYFTSFYDSYIESYPHYTVISKCGSGSKAKLLYRKKRSKSPITDKKLLQLYYFIRAKESSLNWDQVTFDKEFDQAYEVFKAYGVWQAVDYINSKTNSIVGAGANYGNIIKKEDGKRIIHNHHPSYKSKNFKITL